MSVYFLSCSSFMRSWPYRWLSALGSAERMHTNMPGSSLSYWSVILSYLFINLFIYSFCVWVTLLRNKKEELSHTSHCMTQWPHTLKDKCEFHFVINKRVFLKVRQLILYQVTWQFISLLEFWKCIITHVHSHPFSLSHIFKFLPSITSLTHACCD